MFIGIAKKHARKRLRGKFVRSNGSYVRITQASKITQVRIRWRVKESLMRSLGSKWFNGDVG